MRRHSLKYWEKLHRRRHGGMTLAQIADAHHAAIEAMSAEDRAAYVVECQRFRREQALLAMPLASKWIN
jgi:hypothetical protein